MSKILSLPTLLTLVRLLVSPIMLPFLIVYLLPFGSIGINISLSVLFFLFSLTDFFDGYLARKYRQETALGKMLDPIADKCLTYSVLIALLAIHKIYFMWVIILIGRDLFIMALRQVSLERGFSLSVSWLAKIKTAVQLMFIFVLILNPYHSLKSNGISGWITDFWVAPRWMATEGVLLFVTILLALITLRDYYRQFIVDFLSNQNCNTLVEEN